MILCGILPRSKLSTAVWKLLTRCIYSTCVQVVKNMDANHSHDWDEYDLKSSRFYVFTGDTVPSLLCCRKINARLEAVTAVLLNIQLWDFKAVSLGEQFPTFRKIVVRFIFRVKQPKKRNRLESVMLRLAVSHGFELRLRSWTDISLGKVADALSRCFLSEHIVGSALVRRRSVCNTY